MAMSLEDLLAEEGFKRRKSKTMPRTSSASEGRNMPPYISKHESGLLMAVKRTERTRSDIPRYGSKGDFSASSSFAGRKPRDNLSKVKIDWESEKEASLKNERRSRPDSWDAKRFSIGSYEDFRGSEITEVVQTDEIVEVGMNRRYKDIYSNKVYSHERNEEREWHRQEFGNNILVGKEIENNFSQHPRRSMKQCQGSHNRLNRLSGNDKKIDESGSRRQSKLEEALATPALAEAAVKAIICILSGYIKCFAIDEEFRTSLHHNSFASLNFIGLDEGLNTESKVVENLEQAIEIVERAAEENATSKELKKASLQLSVITGLNSKDLKDGFTSGIPNYKLSACAHLYLSVIYMLQKKDRITAKHLLQVFCDSPFQARTTLLPDLWDQVFLPNLLHLKLWYDKESRSLSVSPILTNLKLLEKVYNETMDSGTYQFATYYKDWITEGVDAPSLPSIRIPSVHSQLMPRGGSYSHTSSPASLVSPQPMVSKKLYDEVFRHSQGSGVELEVYEIENFDISAKSSSSPPEDKQLILYSHDSDTCTDPNIEPGPESLHDTLPEETWTLHHESSSRVANLDESYDYQWHRDSSHMSHALQVLPSAKGNILLLEGPENPVLELRQLQQPQENFEDLTRDSSLCSIPKDFLCPLTGHLFEDPVTLETGQTFEREALTDWFGKGWITCPVTRKTLQCHQVPPTNLILKRVIDKWKTDHFRRLLMLLSQIAADSTENIEVNDNMTICILEQLVAVFSKEERMMNARGIISFGGLQFLLRRFQCGNTEEKAFILPLLSCCIEAEASCRNDIARNINKLNLLELLQSKQSKSQTNAVSLLTELICLNRRISTKGFLENLQHEEIINAMEELIMYLQTSCSLEQRPLVAVLLLHLDILPEPHPSNNIYRQEAVDTLTTALERSLIDESVRKKCAKALLILGGFFSSSGKLMTEDWILRQAGFLNGPDRDIADNDIDISVDARVTVVDSPTEDDEEDDARENWLSTLSASLFRDGKKSFLDTISKCLSLGNSDLVRVCLTTVAWLSSSLASLSDTEIQLNAFSALISPLKQCLAYGELVEHKILASLSLLNFSKIPECRVMLMRIAEEIKTSLENLAEVTWTSKELYAIISGHRK